MAPTWDSSRPSGARRKRAPLGELAGGLAAAILGPAVLVLVMLPFRAHMSPATAALVLVVPVVIAVGLGGFSVGALAVATGFLAYDFFFVPPYMTLAVGQLQDWAALGVYALTMLVVARVASSLREARARVRRREDDTRRLFDLSVLLIDDKPLDVLLGRVASALREQFSLESVGIMLPIGQKPEMMARAGLPFDDEELGRLVPRGGVAVPAGSAARPGLRVLPLAASDRAVGLLALRGPGLSDHDGRLLDTFANQTALAVERALLRRQAIRNEALEAADALRRSLVGSVSHNLRTPLATIKAAVSDLRDSSIELADDDRRELLEAIEAEADRLARLVRNLLDMSRIEAGMLVPKMERLVLQDLVSAALGHLGSYWAPPLELDIPEDLPQIEADGVLIEQVLSNLLENAVRHAPGAGPVELHAEERGGRVCVEVRDHGPGFAGAPEYPGASMGMGMGISICRAFVEAHGGSVVAEETPGGGATFRFDVPAAGHGGEQPGQQARSGQRAKAAYPAENPENPESVARAESPARAAR